MPIVAKPIPEQPYLGASPDCIYCRGKGETKTKVEHGQPWVTDICHCVRRIVTEEPIASHHALDIADDQHTIATCTEFDPFDDPHNLGQAVKAQHMAEIALDQMSDIWEAAFTPEHCNRDVRGHALSWFWRARLLYHRAQIVIANEAPAA